MKEIHRMALFRLSVLGPLISLERLEHGELQHKIQEAARLEYAIPGSQRRRLSAKVIERWYYAWQREGLQGLTPKVRADRGRSKISAALQEAIVQAKQNNPRRSVSQIRRLLQADGRVGPQGVSRSAIHRLLQQNGLSKRASGDQPEERRSFTAEFAGSIWYGDVMHGPRLMIDAQMRKTYLVTLFDDASRLVTHSAFCLGETALDVEGVLKQALLKRGRPIKLVVDNGAAYRAHTLQGVCARLGIHLIYCRPYSPEAKGKLERWHKTCRDAFLSELDTRCVHGLEDLNARLWAWLEQVYHHSPHAGLGGETPLARYQRDLARIRTLGSQAAQLDSVFHHRIKRLVRKDGTVSYEGRRFEVPYELSGKTVQLVVDPHARRVVGVEDTTGQSLGQATLLDPVANNHRVRHKPDPVPAESPSAPHGGPNLVELTYKQYYEHGSRQGSHQGPRNDEAGA